MCALLRTDKFRYISNVRRQLDSSAQQLTNELTVATPPSSSSSSTSSSSVASPLASRFSNTPLTNNSSQSNGSSSSVGPWANPNHRSSASALSTPSNSATVSPNVPRANPIAGSSHRNAMMMSSPSLNSSTTSTASSRPGSAEIRLERHFFFCCSFSFSFRG